MFVLGILGENFQNAKPPFGVTTTPTEMYQKLRSKAPENGWKMKLLFGGCISIFQEANC